MRQPSRFVTLSIVALAVLAAPALTTAQQKTHRIGWLISAPSSSAPTLKSVEGFQEALGELGYVEGRNLVTVRRHADGNPAQLAHLAAELVTLNVDIIVTDSSDATHAAQRATSKIPIVMAVSGSPVAQGLVASLARPGGNITGLSLLGSEAAGKRLELLKELNPLVRRVAVLKLPASPNSIDQWRETAERARLLGLDLQPLEVSATNPDFERLFAAAADGKADALVALADPMIPRHAARIAALARKHRIPAIYFEPSIVAAGGLMSYGPSIPAMFRRAATYVDKIIKGAKPGDLPIEQPTNFELTLNLGAAKALGITFPANLMTSADEVIR